MKAPGLAVGTARFVAAVVATAVATVLAPSDAQAHLMPAQRGTLNIVAADGGTTGAYLVLSIPVSAFHDVDDDGDGLLSHVELQRHAANIEQQLRAQVQVLGKHGALPLQGLMLQLSPPDETPAAPAAQLVVMGRFALGTLGAPGNALHLSIGLQGQHAGEQRFDVFVTRQDRSTSPSPRATPAQHVVIEPKRQTQAILPTDWQRWVQRLRSWLR